MSEKKTFRGPWGQRFFIVVLSILLGVLLYWLLGFVTKDIGTMKGPDYTTVRDEYVDAADLEFQRDLKNDLSDVKKQIAHQQEQQRILKDTTSSLQNTMNQLLSIQKQSIENQAEFSEESKQTLRESQVAFLENQKKYEAYNNEIASLKIRQRDLEDNLESATARLKKQENDAREQHRTLLNKHRFKVAVVRHAVLIPVFLIAAWFFITKRTGTYWPIVWSAFIAVFVKIALVAHEYFPRIYFKYIAIFVILAIVLRILVYLIKRIVAPKKDWIVKQFQESYDKARCPICSKPIRTGPLRHIAGMKRKSLIIAGSALEKTEQQPYTCPSCGTSLYSKCDNCAKIRHTLLPHCEHCGAQKPGKLETMDGGN
ncbi:MAG: hypothetical protein ACYSW0_21260 [Planctomycetota bacterium]|jgi:uncharacterized membrane protein (DUF106 family)/predicted RNA-binding Zn-ribbon protein involved in translation (DUF1610 family)